jgi:hypothetical protein
MENKKHIRLAAYFGQNLRRLCLLEMGVFSIIFLQLIIMVILGMFNFSSTKDFLGFLKGDFLYRDSLGLVTANCFCFGVLTFGLGYFLNRREYKNQKVIYREVLKNELANKPQKVQRKFLSPHIVYFSGLDQRIKKTEFEEELREYIDYARENDSLSSEESLILNEEKQTEHEERFGNFANGFKRGKDQFGRVNVPDFDESVDRVIFPNNHLGVDNTSGERLGRKSILRFFKSFCL